MSNSPGPYDPSQTYLRLRGDGSTEPLEVGPSFWQNLSAGRLGDFGTDFLITSHTYDADWPIWEMHPNGDEFVFVIAGQMTSSWRPTASKRR